MSLRRTSRRDENEPGIIDALVSIGAQVKPMQRPCDLIVRFRGQNYLLEVDNPASKYRKRDQAQLDFLRDWEVPIVQTRDDALRAVGAIT